MDSKVLLYLSRYRACMPILYYQDREAYRAQGRSLQSLHEKAIEYAKTLPEDERTPAIKALRRRYNTYVDTLRDRKKNLRKMQSFYAKYSNKRLLIYQTWGVAKKNPMVGKLDGYYNRLMPQLVHENGEKTSFSLDSVKKVETINENAGS